MTTAFSKPLVTIELAEYELLQKQLNVVEDILNENLNPYKNALTEIINTLKRGDTSIRLDNMILNVCVKNNIILRHTVADTQLGVGSISLELKKD